MIADNLQWGGRFTEAPDAALLAFGSSLRDDLPLALADARCSLAHVAALAGGNVISAQIAHELQAALQHIIAEIQSGEFAAWAQECGAEDIHGAIDARVRELKPEAGDFLHSGRSRNDQVATTLRSFMSERCAQAAQACADAAATLTTFAESALERETLLPAMTHWQPAQPALLAFWLGAAAEPMLRAARRCDAAATMLLDELPLGSGAVCGSSLPLDREAARAELGFARLSPNAMDAIGSRDVVLEAAHAMLLALVSASRVCEEVVLWCNPLLGFARLGDAASTGSSLMPQKRNPDPFELVRGLAAVCAGTYAGAVASTCGLALSYHRDLQQTKSAVADIAEKCTMGLHAFAGALKHLRFNDAAMTAAASVGFTVATDVADSFVAAGASAREAHARAGALVLEAERSGTELPLTAAASVNAKATAGSTNPKHVQAHLQSLRARLQ